MVSRIDLINYSLVSQSVVDLFFSGFQSLNIRYSLVLFRVVTLTSTMLTEAITILTLATSLNYVDWPPLSLNILCISLNLG
jgi:hypothetical protein